jgi:hypothetical protein
MATEDAKDKVDAGSLELAPVESVSMGHTNGVHLDFYIMMTTLTEMNRIHRGAVQETDKKDRSLPNSYDVSHMATVFDVKK